MKTKEELNALKEEEETVSRKIIELDVEELEQAHLVHSRGEGCDCHCDGFQ